MKYTRFILILIAVIAVYLVLFLFTVIRDESQTQNFAPQEPTPLENFETRTDDQGQVTVTVTPLSLSGSQGKFDIALDTHSVDLNQDIIQIAEIADDLGNVYKPTSWEEDGTGGHHRRGILVFQPISSTATSVELKIKDIDGVPERSFKWTLK